MWRRLCSGLVSLLLGLIFLMLTPEGGAVAEMISLPQPSFKGKVSVEEALKARRTHRSFKTTPLKLAELGQLLWAAYGVTAEKHGYQLKTAPSAGALYPIDLYAVIGDGGVAGLEAGVYLYQPTGHGLELVKEGDLRARTAQDSLGQTWMARAPIILVITSEYARITVKYGRRGVLYAHIEAGHVGQNIFLQAEALGLKAGIVGAFDNDRIIK
ncbi:MAG: SagB/ThcOx family dehydrogenase, partial [Deltaproteobacteria bacterium]|nr:SagB/ThcOx family dehydrogenase [Deltaproteobacteria bacterium]